MAIHGVAKSVFAMQILRTTVLTISNNYNNKRSNKKFKDNKVDQQDNTIDRQDSIINVSPPNTEVSDPKKKHTTNIGKEILTNPI